MFVFNTVAIGHGVATGKGEVSMPNQTPVSRYLLLGIAIIMFAAALPDTETLLRKVRELKQPGSQRAVYVDGVRLR